MDACLSERWDEAAACHLKLHRWEADHVASIERQGHRHAVVARALIEMSNFLVNGQPTRPPYYPVSKDLQDRLQSSFLEFWADELSQESWYEPSR